jgi:hypothetical protein
MHLPVSRLHKGPLLSVPDRSSEVVAIAVLEEREGASAGDGLDPRMHSRVAVDAHTSSAR